MSNEYIQKMDRLLGRLEASCSVGEDGALCGECLYCEARVMLNGLGLAVAELRIELASEGGKTVGLERENAELHAALRQARALSGDEGVLG